MSKKIFPLLIAVLTLAMAHAQQVEEVQRTLLSKRTATWCPNCGNYGWTMMTNIIADNADNATIIAAHETGSSLGTTTGEEYTNNFGTLAQPSFFLNEVNQGVNSSNIAAKRTQISDQVEAAFASQPVVNVGFEPVYDDGAIHVAAKVRFFQPASGEYFLSIYLLEDNVEAQQAGSVTNNIHQRVLRYNFSDFTYGEVIVNGDVTAGQEFSKTYSLLIGDPDGYDYHVAGIIWKLEAGKYVPVNTWSTTTIETGTALAVQGVSNLTKFEVAPTIAVDEATIRLELTENQPLAVLEVYDLSGRLQATIFDGVLSAGSHSFRVNRSQAGGSGTFIVRFTDGARVSSQRVIFK